MVDQHIIHPCVHSSVHVCVILCVCVEVPLSAGVDGWRLAVGNGVMGDWRRSFGGGRGGSGGRVGGAEVQAAVFQAVILHGVTAGHVLPQLLELGRAQACCNTHTHNQGQSSVFDHILLLPNNKQTGRDMLGNTTCVD